MLIKDFFQRRLSEPSFKILGTFIGWAAGLGTVAGIVFMVVMGKASIGHRIIALISPSYARRANPLTSSISEHASTPWGAMYNDMHYSMLFAPLGAIILLVGKPNNSHIFGVLYCLVSTYFASVMIRLKMVAGPSSAVLTGAGLSYAMAAMSQSVKEAIGWACHRFKLTTKLPTTRSRVPWELSLVGIALIAWLLCRAVFHGSKTSAQGLTNTGITREVNFNNGGRIIIDELREGYYWLRTNTDPDASVMSWWDYGYQIAGMGNRSTIIDNNTWNKTHIARVGMVGWD